MGVFIVILIVFLAVVALLIYGGVFLFDGLVDMLNRIFENDLSKSEAAFVFVGVLLFAIGVVFAVRFYKTTQHWH